VLILIFGPISGAHFYPVVSIADRVFGRAILSGAAQRIDRWIESLDRAK
jgi:glycerol uptake facilitator-like aquaporin